MSSTPEKMNSSPNLPKANSTDSLPDAEVPKPADSSYSKAGKRPMSDKMKEEAKAIAQLMAEQEKDAKAKGPQKDGESCDQQMKNVLGKPNTLIEKEAKKQNQKEGSNEEKKKSTGN
jgi:hypothetical protein